VQRTWLKRHNRVDVVIVNGQSCLFAPAETMFIYEGKKDALIETFHDYKSVHYNFFLGE
jgi:hypothetical protein